MIILAPVLILIFTAVILSLIGWLRPRFAYQWLLAAGGAFLAWLMVWFLRGEIVRTLPLMDWGLTGLLEVSPVVRLDGISWAFALALLEVFSG